MAVEDAAKYEMPFEFVKVTVYPERRKNHREAYKEKLVSIAKSGAPRPYGDSVGATGNKVRFPLNLEIFLLRWCVLKTTELT
jgi:hypothetical protein